MPSYEPSKEDKKEYAERMRRKRMALALNTIRRSRGLSEMQLAEKSGYKTSSVITAIENGTTEPSYEKVKDIANALDVSIGQLRASGKIGLNDEGWPKLNESERVALFILAPILKALDDESIEYLISTGLMLCRATGREPEWKKAKFKEDKGSDETRL